MTLLSTSMPMLVASGFAPVVGAVFLFAGKALTWDTPYVFSKVTVWTFITIFLFSSFSAFSQALMAIDDPAMLEHVWGKTVVQRWLFLPCGFFYWLASLEMTGRLPAWVVAIFLRVVHPIKALKQWLKKKYSETAFACYLARHCAGIPAEQMEVVRADADRVVRGRHGGRDHHEQPRNTLRGKQHQAPRRQRAIRKANRLPEENHSRHSTA